MNLAMSSIKTLIAYARQPTLTSPLTPPSASSSSVASVPTNDADLDKARIESMNRLIGVMQRNLRVRYEVDVNDIVRGYVGVLSFGVTKPNRYIVYYPRSLMSPQKKLVPQHTDFSVTR